MSHTDTEQTVPVEKIKKGEFVKRKEGANKTYQRGEYHHSDGMQPSGYSLIDVDDVNREIFVRKGTKLFVGFTY